jgi:pimeloyl-ACP methyl ester carboxylesterase
MELYHQIFPDESEISECAGSIPLLIIPGLFGSTSNWRGIARKFAETEPVIVIDQRNHGRSPRADKQTYADMVDDLVSFCDQHELSKINLCGHSMGGKVAMLFTLRCPDIVNKLIVLDIAPIRYTHNHAAYIRALMAVDLANLKSRNEADKLLREQIPDIGTRMFLLQSLVGSPGSYHWRLNLPVLLEFMDEISDFPECQESASVTSLFLAGQRADYLRPRHHSKILEMFPNSRFEDIEGAGHWLHAEKPAEVLNAVNNFLEE